MTFSIPKLAATIGVILITPAPALAKWIPLIVMDNNPEIQVNPDLIVQHGSFGSLWVRNIFPIPESGGNYTYGWLLLS